MARIPKILPGAVVLAFLVLAAAPLRAGEAVAVIVNRLNPAARLDETEIKRIYTNSVLTWPDGSPISIYDLAISNPLRYSFSEKILAKTPSKVAQEWAHLKITNQAKNPPRAIKSEALIIRRVSREKGAIGYVSLGLVKDNGEVRIVSVLR
ncbi:MAG: hypothetical protein ACE5GY_03040 [Thermodesulfobacteriota bacterium]